MPPMKVKKYSALLALLMTSGLIHAQTIVPAPGVIVQGSAVVQGPALVNGTLTVQPELTTTVGTPVVDTNPGTPTILDEINPTGTGGPTKIIQTLVQTADTTQSTTTGGGVRAETNGNLTLSATSAVVEDKSYGTLVTQEVAQAGNSNTVGVAIPGTEKYYLVNKTTGAIIPTTPVFFASPALVDAFVTSQTVAQLEALDPSLAESTDVPGNGGNLVVEGNSTLGDAATDTTTVNGALVANNGLDATGDKITNLANGTAATDAANLGQVNAGDATLQTNINTEATTRAAADTAIRGEFAAADTTLQTNINTEASTRAAADTAIRSEVAAADTTLQNNINTEASTRAAADTAIRGEFAAADTALGTAVRSEFAAADTVERNARTAADTAIRGEFATADTALGGRIDSEISARIAGDTAVRSEFAAADTVIRTQFAAADTAIRNEFAAADTALGTAVRNEFAAADTPERNARIAGDSRLQSNIDENTRGIAMVAAMTNTTVDIGKTHGVDFNMAQFQSETGFAFGYANRINENVQVHTSVASTTDFDESVVRLGVAVQW